MPDAAQIYMDLGDEFTPDSSVSECNILSEDLTGSKFGSLIVLGRGRKLSKGPKSDYWICKCCRCGNEIEISRFMLGSGYRGCMCSSGRRGSRGGVELRGKNYMYNRYIKNARDRGIKFDIPKVVFGIIIKMNCFYCGSEPKEVPVSGVIDGFRSNGIDRFDNSEGYSISNCVPCCDVCNSSKLEMTAEEYIDRCRSVVSFNDNRDIYSDFSSFISSILSSDGL